MNDLSNSLNSESVSLDARLREHPQLQQRLHALVDVIDAAAGDCRTAAQAEARVVEEIRQIGRQALTSWAQRADQQAQAEVPAQNPSAVRDGKKKLPGIRFSEPSR